MNQLQVRSEGNFDLILKDVQSMQNMCKELMKTKHYQKMGEDGIFAVVQSAKSLGLHPLEALNGALYYVQGKVGMGSETMNALIRRRGHSIVKDAKSNDTICILHGKRADTGDTWTVHFSIDDARKAGLLKNMYDKYPSIMLYNRAMSMLARQLFPDIIHNAGYNKEELEEIASNKVNTSFDSLKSVSESYEEVVEYITENQVIEVNACLAMLDSTIKENFMLHIREKYKAKDVPEIQKKDFNTLINILKRRLENVKKAQQEAQEAQEVLETENENTEEVG